MQSLGALINMRLIRKMENNYYLRKLLLFVALYSFSVFATASSNIKPDFSKMKGIDHAGRVYTNGSKNYLVIFKNYYKKEVSAYAEVPILIPEYHYISEQCALDGKFNVKITAYVKLDLKQEKWKEVRHAWLVDASTSSIMTIEPTRVYCFNDAWGA